MLFIIFFGTIFYYSLPFLLNYPKNVLNTSYEVEINKFMYYQQYLIFGSVIIFLGILYFNTVFKKIERLLVSIVANGEDWDSKNKIRALLINLPYKIYLFIMIVPVVSVFLFLTILFSNVNWEFLIKVGSVVLIFGTAIAQIMLVFCKKIFGKILLTYLPDYYENNFYRIGFLTKNLMHFLPLLVASIILVSLIGYAMLIQEKGKILHELYRYELVQLLENLDPEEEVEEILVKILPKEERLNQIIAFVISPQGDVFTSDGTKMETIFLMYLQEYSLKGEGRIRHYYNPSLEGTAIRITLKGENYIVGLQYQLLSRNVLYYLTASFFMFFCINILTLIYSSKNFADEINMVVHELTKIAETDQGDGDHGIVITSQDEVSDLIEGVNCIMDKHKDYLNQIKFNQMAIFERERLASLGNLIGGIAHNLKTPVMSISGGGEGFLQLIDEYERSIEDEKVTEEDHKEIVSDMRGWLSKIQSHCAYISDIITAVKSQSHLMGSKSKESFSVQELIKRVEILMKHELKLHQCTLQILELKDKTAEITGEITSLIQVINNLIQNAIDAYEGKGGEIVFGVKTYPEKIIFSVKDKGRGIPKEVKEKIFKVMFSSKGSGGTGIGLYASYSSIVGNFGGEIWFETQENEGTVFYISIPR